MSEEVDVECSADELATANYCKTNVEITDSNGNVVYTVKNAVENWYRVRKSWSDANSQIGAYKVLDNAINEYSSLSLLTNKLKSLVSSADSGHKFITSKIKLFSTLCVVLSAVV